VLLRKLASEVLKMAQEHRLQGQTEVQGIPIAIENRVGDVRTGVDRDGHRWRTRMSRPYGYIKGTKGKDGEEIDAFVGPVKDAPKAYVVHQHKPDGTGHDEDKVMLGFRSKEEAKKTYLQHYDDPKFLGPISTLPVEALKEKLDQRAGVTIRKLAALVLPRSTTYAGQEGTSPASTGPQEGRGSAGILGHVGASEDGGSTAARVGVGRRIKPMDEGAMHKIAEAVDWLVKFAEAVQPKGIKFVYINTGGGHKAQANAMAEAARKMGIPAETVDWGDHFAKGPHLKQYERTYGEMLHGRANQLDLAIPMLKFTFGGTDHEKLRSWVKENKDQAIVVAMEHLRKEFKGIDHPIHTLHSDPVKWPFAQGGGNEPNRIDVGLRSVLDEIKAKNRVAISNVPVSQGVLRPKGKSGLITPKKFNVTVSGGSLGAEVVPLVKQVLLSKLPENVVVHAVAGRDPVALRELQSLAKIDPRLQPHGFAPLAHMMHEADLNVIRTHGTTFAESVAAGKPAVYYGPDIKFGLLEDGQGDLTKRTAIYAGQHVGHPVAIGLENVPEAVNKVVEDHDRYRRLAIKAKRRMGDPASEAVRQIMRPRPDYVVKTAAFRMLARHVLGGK